jgi:hypothetical protein
MSNRNVHLRGHEATGHRRVHVAHDKDKIRLFFLNHFFEGRHDASGLLRMGGTSDAEVSVRARKLQLFEEDIAHLLVVVLPGMHDKRLESLSSGLKGAVERSHLHEVRTGTYDTDDFYHFFEEILFAMKMPNLLDRKCCAYRRRAVLPADLRFEGCAFYYIAFCHILHER